LLWPYETKNFSKKRNEDADSHFPFFFLSVTIKIEMAPRNTDSFASYIHKIWKSLNGPGNNARMSKSGTMVMDAFVKDMFGKISAEASVLLRHTKTATMSRRSIETAVKTVVGGELSVMALQSIQKAAGNTSSLGFPEGRLHRHLREGRYAGRVSRTAANAMAATLEYLVSEVLEVAGRAMRESGKKTLRARHITLAIHRDEELHQLWKDSTIASGGVLPYIPQAVMSKKKK
jgi:histone H2A